MRARFVALVAVAVLSLGGFVGPTPGVNNAGSSPGAHTIYGSGGPLEGLSDRLLESRQRRVVWHEDFDLVMPDYPAGVLEWNNSGWTMVDQGVPANHLIRNVGGSVMNITPGTTSNTGVHARHNGRRRLSDAAGAFDGASQFDLMRAWSLGYASEGYGYQWAAEMTLVGGAPWNASLFIGHSMPESLSTGIMVNTTGVITCPTSWLVNGGVGFHIDRDSLLRLVICADGPNYAVGDVNTGTDTFNNITHNLLTGDGPVRVSSSVIPAGLSATTDYWVRAVSATSLAFYTSQANAISDTSRQDITGVGTGPHVVNIFTTRDVDLAASLEATGELRLALGLKVDMLNNANECNVQAWYAKAPELGAEGTIPWVPLGTAVEGFYCPDYFEEGGNPALERFNFTVEYVAGTGAAGSTMFLSWVDSGQVRE